MKHKAFKNIDAHDWRIDAQLGYWLDCTKEAMGGMMAHPGTECNDVSLQGELFRLVATGSFDIADDMLAEARKRLGGDSYDRPT